MILFDHHSQNTQREHKHQSSALSDRHLQLHQLGDREGEEGNVGRKPNAKRDVVEREQLQTFPWHRLARIPRLLDWPTLEDHHECFFHGFSNQQSYQTPT